MNSENLEQSQNTSIHSINSNQIHNSHSIDEEVKKNLASLLKRRLDKKLTKLENRSKEGEKSLKYTFKIFEEYNKIIESLNKGIIETMKEKEISLKKTEEEKRKKFESKTHNSKSLVQNKRLNIITKSDYLTNRNERKNLDKNKLNNTSRINYHTEVVKKEQVRPKTFKGHRIKNVDDDNKIKVKPLKVDKISNISSPLRPEDNKAKTMSNISTDKKVDKKKIISNKNKSTKKKIRPKNLELSQNFSDLGNRIKKIEKFTSEKTDKKTQPITQDKINKKSENKKQIGKKIITKKENDKIKKLQNKKEKKDDDKKEENKIEKEENKIDNNKKEDKNIQKEEVKKEENIEEIKDKVEKIENKENAKENKNSEQKEDIKIENLEKLDEKNENETKKEQKEKDEPKREEKKENETKKEPEEKNEPKKEEKIKKDLEEDNIKKDEDIKIQDEKKENKQTTIPLSQEEIIPKEKEIVKKEEKIENEKKTENDEKKLDEIKKETDKNLQPEIKKEEVSKLTLEEKQSDLPIEQPEINIEKKEPSVNIETQKQEGKLEEKIEEKNNEEQKQKSENEKNEHLIETLRKDNENMKKENEDELLKHYQSQYINLSLNQSMNQSMSFSQSFLQSRSILGEHTKEKIARDPNAPLTLDEIIKKYKNDFIYIFDFLDFKDRIQFSGIHKGFKNERIYLLNTKREEAIASLELKERETINDRLNKFKLDYSSNEYTKPLGTFTLAKNSVSTTLCLDKPTFSSLFKQAVLDIKLSDIYIVYRVLFVFMGETKIAEIVEDGEFWKKCIEYLNNNGKEKIGSFILAKSKDFDFSHKTIYLLNKLLIGIKPNINPAFFSKISGTTGMLIFLIKDALEFCGVLVAKKTPKSRIYDNLVFYKNIIDHLTSFIDFLSKIKVSK